MNDVLASRPHLDLGFASLGQPSAHVGVFARSPEERESVVADFFTAGIAAGDPCLLVCGRSEQAALSGVLRRAGLAASMRAGRVALLDSEEAYLTAGEFDPDGAIERLKGRLKAAGDGRTLRVCSDMSWALASTVAPEAVEALERRFNRALSPFRSVAALCVYDLDRFGYAWGRAAYATHPHAVVGRNFFQNPAFEK